jgi:hypothetical protein
VHAYNTPVYVLVLILVGYIGLSLALGGRKVYFEPLTEKPEDPEGMDKRTKRKATTTDAGIEKSEDKSEQKESDPSQS